MYNAFTNTKRSAGYVSKKGATGKMVCLSLIIGFLFCAVECASDRGANNSKDFSRFNDKVGEFAVEFDDDFSGGGR